MVPMVLTLTLALLLAAMPAAGGEPTKIAVTEIQARRGVDPALARVVEDILVDEMTKIESVTVIGRDDILRMLDPEQQNQFASCEVASCLAEIGAEIGVDQFLVGSLAQVGKSVIISLRLIDTPTATILARESKRLRWATEDDVLDEVKALSFKLLRTQPSAGPATAASAAIEPAAIEPARLDPAPTGGPKRPGRQSEEFIAVEAPPGRVWTWVAAGVAAASLVTGVGLMAWGNREINHAQELADRSRTAAVRFDTVAKEEDAGIAKWAAGGPCSAWVQRLRSARSSCTLSRRRTTPAWPCCQPRWTAAWASSSEGASVDLQAVPSAPERVRLGTSSIAGIVQRRLSGSGHGRLEVLVPARRRLSRRLSVL